MKSLLVLLVGVSSLSACAQPGSSEEERAAAQLPLSNAGAQVLEDVDARAVEAVRQINPTLQVDRVSAAPIPGFREVIVSGQVLYISDDGRYLIQGSLFDIQARADLSQSGLAEVRRELVSTVPASEKIVFAPENPDYTVTVFTDVGCGFCRRLHQEVDEYNRLGIAIEYLAYPRGGPGSEDFRTMEAVWCSSDRRQAMNTGMAGRPVRASSCETPVLAHYELGNRVGLTGTPLIVTESGASMPGYMPPAALRETLDQLAGQAPGN